MSLFHASRRDQDHSVRCDAQRSAPLARWVFSKEIPFGCGIFVIRYGTTVRVSQRKRSRCGEEGDQQTKYLCRETGEWADYRMWQPG